MTRRIFSLVLLTLVTFSAMAQSLDQRRLIVKDKNGTQQVYDVSKLTRITFDSVETVTPELSLVSVGGLSAKINVVLPDGASSYRVAFAKKNEEITNWNEYIQQDSKAITGVESQEITLGGLEENTEYVVGALAYDKYNIPSGMTTLEFKTAEATQSEKPNVGDLLFSDGSWGNKIESGKTPVAVVFSTTPSEADKAMGYTHGYAIALKNATQKVAWAVTPSGEQTGHYTSSDSLGYQTDKDGLSHTRYLVEQGAGFYPAADAAVSYNVDAPENSSGWYLPSSGQWYDIVVNLGGLDSQMPVTGKTEGYWNKASDVNSSVRNINDHLKVAGTDLYEPISVPSGDYLWFWTSSESGDSQAYAIFFDNDQLVVEIAGYFKTYAFSSNRVRAVLAF